MATLNKVMLIGRLTKDPDPPRAMPSGGQVISFRLAVGRSKKNPQTGQWENDPNTLYIDCDAFTSPGQKRDLVSLVQQYCKRGDQIFVEGRLRFDEWEDKNGGGKRSKHKLAIDSLEFLGGKSGGDEGGAGGEGGSRAVSRGGSYGGGVGGGGRPAQQAPARGGYSAPDDDEYGGGGSSNAGGGKSEEDIPF